MKRLCPFAFFWHKRNYFIKGGLSLFGKIQKNNPQQQNKDKIQRKLILLTIRPINCLHLMITDRVLEAGVEAAEVPLVSKNLRFFFPIK